MLDADASVAAALLVGGPADRMQKAMEALEPVIRKAAAEASALMGSASVLRP